MNLFQILSLIVLIGLSCLSISAAALGKATRREAVFWCVLWFLAALAILKPDLTTTLAQWVGIRRGADLLLYCSVGVMMLGFMMIYSRLRRLRREVTLIVRHLALNEATRGPSNENQKN